MASLLCIALFPIPASFSLSFFAALCFFFFLWDAKAFFGSLFPATAGGLYTTKRQSC